MVLINKYQIHEKEISYLEDILLSSNLSKLESFNLYNYFSTKDMIKAPSGSETLFPNHKVNNMKGVNVQFSAERDLNQHDNITL